MVGIMRSPLALGVIADDLTSATDGAAPFLARGYVPVVLRRPSSPTQEAIIAVDTGSRAAATGVEAAAATARGVAALAHAPILYKTALSASGRRRLIVAPAFPEAGRITVGGQQRVHGVPVHESAYGRDPVHPARTSSVPDLLTALDLPIRLLPSDASAGDVDAVRDAPVTVLDADSQEALDRTVALVPDPQDVLWVGSPGLARALAARMPSCPGPIPEPVRARRVLIVAGSANPATHAQCDALAASGVPILTHRPPFGPGPAVLCLRAPAARRDEAKAVLDALTEEAVAAFASGAFDALIATGGETMAALLDRIGVVRFTLATEFEPGFPVGVGATQAGPIAIAMKAGGFGTPETLLAAARRLLDPPRS